ncbi:putative DNA-binding transcriptional regulator AlpA [Metabacillus crassostreae]|uniref:helix-turn-helix domain-containing protein n=1 Tax=Metabacillus crassostreae TaxID=929098 RepID=UPI00195C2E99|nr:helix-turn-helix domain-containing protein [Metabacillus crassostreae]MBM7602591.1 putative DNA-binding transcriptional regulator AlpA [Metabacillus crassostreae]
MSKKLSIGDFPIILTAKDISDILHVSKPTAYEIMNRSDFPLMRIGRCKRVLRDEFFNWVKSKGVLR